MTPGVILNITNTTDIFVFGVKDSCYNLNMSFCASSGSCGINYNLLGTDSNLNA